MLDKLCESRDAVSIERSIEEGVGGKKLPSEPLGLITARVHDSSALGHSKSSGKPMGTYASGKNVVSM